VNIILPLVCAALVTAAAPNPELDTFFDELIDKRQYIQSLKAEFTQKNFNPNEIYESEGTITFANPRKLLFEYMAPNAQSLLFLDDVLYEYDVELQQLVVRRMSDMSEMETLFLAFESNPERLRESYDLSLATPPSTAEAGCNGRVLILKPKTNDGGEQLFQQASIYLREQDYLPCRINVVTSDDSHFWIDVNNYTVNEGVDDKTMSYTLDENVTIIVDDEFVKITEEAGVAVPGDLPVPADPAAGTEPAP